MAVYLVSYDLNRKKDYARLIGRIKQFSAYAQVLYSQWLVESSSTSFDVASDLIKYIDGDDAILVSEMTKNTSWRSLMIQNSTMDKWMNAARQC